MVSDANVFVKPSIGVMEFFQDASGKVKNKSSDNVVLKNVSVISAIKARSKSTFLTSK